MFRGIELVSTVFDNLNPYLFRILFVDPELDFLAAICLLKENIYLTVKRIQFFSNEAKIYE